MKKPAILILFIFLLLVCGGFFLMGAALKTKTQSKPVSLRTYPVKQLKEDFEQFKNVILAQHPMLYTNQAELNDLLVKQAKLLKRSMGELEFYRILAPIVSKLNCGHTGLGFSSNSENFYRQNSRYLPLQLKVIQNRVYVYQNLSNPQIPAGSEIISINGKPIPEIIQTLLDNTCADGANLSKKYYEMNHGLNDLYFKFIDTTEKFTITYIDPTKQGNAQVTLAAVNKFRLDELIRNNSAPKTDNGAYWRRLNKDHALLTITSFAFYIPEQRNQFKAFIDQFFKELAEAGLSNLILDLRDNWGGDPYCSSYLFTYLLQTAEPYFAEDSPGYYDLKYPLPPASNNFKGKLYILTNGASFSSTGHFSSLLKYHQIGVFVGEETGGSFLCTDNSTEEILNNTGIRFRYSRTAFKTAVSGLTPGRGIIPDYEVIPVIEDYLGQKDVVMDFALGLFERKK